MILLGCLAVLVLAGIVERLALVRARRAVPIRIHVNGTRGKSTVTRLIAAALREAGIPTLAKVTGTAPRLVLPDGTERPIRRLAPASIREQPWALRQARRHRARALVVECMAIRPELQWASERDILHSTLGAITNARLDHTDVMGRTVDEIARSLANTVPRHGVLITGDRRAAAVLAGPCASEGTRLVVVDAQITPDPICLAVARELGVDEVTALRGMRRAAADPGAATSGNVLVAGRHAAWIDLTAANDPESTDLLAADWAGGIDRAGGVDRAGGIDRAAGIDRAGGMDGVGGMVCVYNHRDDRPERLATFARACRTFQQADHILITGDYPARPLMNGARRACRGQVQIVPARDLSMALERVLEGRRDIRRVVYCGNTRDFVRPVLER